MSRLARFRNQATRFTAFLGVSVINHAHLICQIEKSAFSPRQRFFSIEICTMILPFALSPVIASQLGAHRFEENLLLN